MRRYLLDYRFAQLIDGFVASFEIPLIEEEELILRRLYKDLYYTDYSNMIKKYLNLKLIPHKFFLSLAEGVDIYKSLKSDLSDFAFYNKPKPRDLIDNPFSSF